MIRYDEIPTLEGEQADRVSALIQRGEEIWEMPEDLGQVDAWEKQAADCEAEGLVHYAASARFGQYSAYMFGGMANEALDAYARVMQLVTRYGEYIAPGNIQNFLGSIPVVVSSLIDDASVPRDRIEMVVDLVEEETRKRGIDPANLFLARAALASEFGEADAMNEWRHRWLAQGSEQWTLDNPDTTVQESTLIDPFSVPEAISLVEQRFGSLGVPPGPLDPDHPKLELLAMLRVYLAMLFARNGQRDIAAIIGNEISEQFGAEWLTRNVILEEAIVALEHRPEDVLALTDYALSQMVFGTSDWRLVAGVARSRILADPQGEEGRMLQQLAYENAKLADERGRTDWHVRQLNEFWFAGLPAGPRPAVLDDPATWGDTQARAERILTAGWFARRKAPIAMDNPPIGLKHRFMELATSAFDILSAESSEEADAMAEAILVQSESFRVPTARFGARLMRAAYAAQSDDIARCVSEYALAQQDVARFGEALDEGMRMVMSSLFPPIIEAGFRDPKTSLEELDRVIDKAQEIADFIGLTSTHQLQAEAEKAAHFGDGAALHRLVGEIARQSEAEQESVDRFQVCLNLVRMVWPYDAAYAESMANWVLTESPDPALQRPALAWTSWFAKRLRGESRADEVITALESVDREIEDFGAVPNSVLVEAVADRPDALPWIIDAMLRDTVPGEDPDYDTFAAIGKVLLERNPEDARGPQLRDLALQIAGELDARDGNTFQSSIVRQRWFPEA
ncbi:MAG: hypothetical protein ACTHXA_07830 [Gulosibacter sp.]|uniref:hypothetical protein n=1 Tax=Gulosibacter sp. TaxID=2817531 RepID=UPI003F8EFEBE